MSVNFGNLLSNSGTNALYKYQSTVDSGNKEGATYSQVLAGISTYNSYTNSYTGMSSSIFDNSSGIANGSSSASYGSNSWQTGKDGLNRNGAVDKRLTNASTISAANNPFGTAAYGASIVDNFLVSIQNTALGQYAPTSVFEQRLNYHLDYDQQNKPGAMLGNYSNYMNVDSVANNLGTSAADIFGDKTSSGANGYSLSKVSSANTVSKLRSMLG